MTYELTVFGQVYAHELGTEISDVVPYLMSHGILLRNDLHYSYDHYQWSLYTKVCLLYYQCSMDASEPSKSYDRGTTISFMSSTRTVLWATIMDSGSLQPASIR